MGYASSYHPGRLRVLTLDCEPRQFIFVRPLLSHTLPLLTGIQGVALIHILNVAERIYTLTAGTTHCSALRSAQ